MVYVIVHKIHNTISICKLLDLYFINSKRDTYLSGKAALITAPLDVILQTGIKNT